MPPFHPHTEEPGRARPHDSTETQDEAASKGLRLARERCGGGLLTEERRREEEDQEGGGVGEAGGQWLAKWRGGGGAQSRLRGTGVYGLRGR